MKLVPAVSLATVVLVGRGTLFGSAFSVSPYSTITLQAKSRPQKFSIWLSAGDNDESTREETEDEMFNRLLQKRIAELDMEQRVVDTAIDKEPETRTSFFQIGTYEVLALLVSVFFVATVTLSGGSLFATSLQQTSPRVVLDADEILRQDFARDASSVPFSSSSSSSSSTDE